jgi:predicted nucleotidyltransferase
MNKRDDSSGAFVQPYRYPSPGIPRAAIRRFAREIGERFHPERIILFGSYANGQPHEESDVDILVIMPTRNEIGTSARIVNALDWPFELDLIVRTPGHVARGLRDGDWFLREVMHEGVILYEASELSFRSSYHTTQRSVHSDGLCDIFLVTPSNIAIQVGAQR